MISLHRRSVALGTSVAIAVVAVDQVAKTWVIRTISVDGERRIVGSLRLVLRYNRGAAFSIGNGTALTAWLASALVVVLAVWMVRTWRQPSPVSGVVALGLILGGALGNQVDRFARSPGWNRGRVVDFVDVGFFAVFNVADAALTCGCIAYVLLLLRNDRRSRTATGARTS